MPDIIEQFQNSVIQHAGTMTGLVMNLDRRDTSALLVHIERLVRRNNYSKVFAKVPDDVKPYFDHAGYNVEARVPCFFNGSIDGWFMARFLNDSRKTDGRQPQCDEVLNVAQGQTPHPEPALPASDYHYRICLPEDTPAMTEVYKHVFETYPFPIHDANYLRQTMACHIVYFGIWHGNNLVALSSAEMDEKSQNVEMTDFATLSEYRGQKLALILLARMEKEMKQRDMKTAYTIARAPSFGMNITFARFGYRYAGRLINNTNIAGGFESMNIWYKSL